MAEGSAGVHAEMLGDPTWRTPAVPWSKAGDVLVLFLTLSFLLGEAFVGDKPMVTPVCVLGLLVAALPSWTSGAMLLLPYSAFNH